MSNIAAAVLAGLFAFIGFVGMESEDVVFALLCVITVFLCLCSAFLLIKKNAPSTAMAVTSVALAIFATGLFGLVRFGEGGEGMGIFMAIVMIASELIFAYLIGYFNIFRKRDTGHGCYVGLNLAEDEKLIRKWDGIGTVCITNRRMAYSCKGGECVQQIKIEDISGFDFQDFVCSKDHDFVYALVVSVASIILATTGAQLNMICSIIVNVFIITVCLLWILKSPSQHLFVIGVKSKKQRYNIFVSEMTRHYFENEYTLYEEPSPEFSDMMRDIGAIVLDLQKFGDSAVEKWKII